MLATVQDGVRRGDAGGGRRWSRETLGQGCRGWRGVPGTLERCEWSGDKNATKHTLDGKMPGESHCSPREIANYLNRVSGPLLDRIDLHIEVAAVKFQDITSQRNGEPSATIRKRVIAARQLQLPRICTTDRPPCLWMSFASTAMISTG
jgi:hypothetical protein